MLREAEKECKKIKKQNAKLRSNVIFGKLTENMLNKVNVKIDTSRKQYLKWSFRQKKKKKIHNGAIAIKKEKCRINLNKSIYNGANTFDLSKVLMQDIH